MSDVPIRFESVSFYYGKTRALDTVSFDVPRGSIFALLGRNGAGKTTALDCLLGFRPPTRGRVELLGHDTRALPPTIRERVGYVPEGHPLVRWMRIQELVRFQGASFAAFDAARCHTYLDRLGLPAKQRVYQLSRGMRAQLSLALALATDPELVILDDPGMGLDAVVRREFLEVMIDLIQKEGRTLLFTSHILTDVERVADHVALLDHGVLRVDAPLDDLKARVRRYRAVYESEAPEPPALPGVVRARRSRQELVLTVVDHADETEAILRGTGARSVDAEGLSLEDLFIDYTTEAKGKL